MRSPILLVGASAALSLFQPSCIPYLGKVSPARLCLDGFLLAVTLLAIGTYTSVESGRDLVSAMVLFLVVVPGRDVVKVEV